MPTPEIIDLSHHNTIPESLQAAKDSGIIGIIHKATEGSSYVDDKLASRYKLAQDAGMAWGCYHFLNEKSSGATQAKFFVDTMREHGVLDDGTLVAADHEDTDAVLALLKEFVITLHDLTQRMPVVYSGHVLKDQLISYVGPDFPVRLWLAQYGPTPELPNGFSDYWLWQYTDKGAVPGIDGYVDLNESRLSNKELLAGWSGRVVTPPEPEGAEGYEYIIRVKSAAPVQILIEKQ